MFTATRLTQALFVAGATFLAGSAHADAYAVATDNIRNGSVTPTAGITFGTVSANSSSSAVLNASFAAGASIVFNPDAPVSAVGSAAGRANELGSPYYTLMGPNGTDYSWGDAIVNQEQTPTKLLRARNAAETNIAKLGFGNADGTNRSSTLLTVGTCPGGCSLSFRFEADPYILASVDALASADSSASGTLDFGITLTRLGAGGGIVFSWKPNGAAGGIIGGTEFLDPESLNLTQTAFAGETTTHSPPYGALGFGSYSAMTDLLAPGKYTLALSMNEKTDVLRAPAVPEPETYALMLAGLGAMGFVARRRKS